MTRSGLIVVGGGEHARVVAEAARSAGGFDVLGFVDPHPCEETVAFGLPRLGGDDALDSYPEASLVLGLGAIGSLDRRVVVERIGSDRRWASVVHGAAWVSPSATVGHGAVVLAGAVVNTRASVEHHVIVNSGAIVEHDARIGAYAQIGPRAAVAGGASIGPSAYVGLGAVVRDHLSVGARVVVGMGAVVVRDVPDGVRVMGVPAVIA